MRGLARVRGALCALLVASLAAVGVGADRASAAEESDDKPRQIYAGGPSVYLVDHAGGTVQALDPVSLVPRGDLHVLGHPTGRPVVDPEGTLWAPLDATGAVVPVRADGVGEHLEVAAPDHSLRVSLISGRVMAIDPSTPAITPVSLAGAGQPVDLPVEMDEVRDTRPEGVLAPPSVESSILPFLLLKERNILLAVDVDTGTSYRYEAPPVSNPNFYGEPVAVGPTLILPNGESRMAFTVDTTIEKFSEIGSKSNLRLNPGRLGVFVGHGEWFVDFNHGAGESNARGGNAS